MKFTKMHGIGNDYAGYDVLLETVDPLWTKGNDKQYGYLYVSEYPYEGTVFQGAYNALEVKVAPYAYLTDPGVQTSEKRIVKNYEEATDKLNDALQARYHWKVTYYATNDSVVFEPLNASRFSQEQYKAFKEGKLNYENSLLATAWGEDYLNTVNAGVAYDNSSAFTRHHNSMHNKAAGVPVALFAMNESNIGDSSKLLTVSAAGGEINSSMDKYAAHQKFTLTSDVTKTDGKTKQNNPAYVTNKSSMMLSTMYADYVAEMRLRVTFNHMYSYLTRATVKSGLYFMNLVKPELTTTQTENRKDGAYIVKDMKGHVVYDTIEKGLQNLHHCLHLRKFLWFELAFVLGEQSFHCSHHEIELSLVDEHTCLSLTVSGEINDSAQLDIGKLLCKYSLHSFRKLRKISGDVIAGNFCQRNFVGHPSVYVIVEGLIIVLFTRCGEHQCERHHRNCKKLFHNYYFLCLLSIQQQW